MGGSQGRRGGREKRRRSKGEVLGAEGGDAGGCEVMDLCADFETYHSILVLFLKFPPFFSKRRKRKKKKKKKSIREF